MRLGTYAPTLIAFFMPAYTPVYPISLVDPAYHFSLSRSPRTSNNLCGLMAATFLLRPSIPI